MAKPQSKTLEPRDLPARPAFRERQVVRDLRFCALVGRTAWAGLPNLGQERFSKRPTSGNSAIYQGQITECRINSAGWLLARLGLAIGAPLPLHRDTGVPAVVTITEDLATGGQFWTRVYGRSRGFPQVIHSIKRFSGPTGLEEYLGYGFGIALAITADTRALHFHADHYFLCIGRLRWRLPRLLAPGALTISHVDHGDGWFAFILTLRHPRFGELVHQVGMFQDRTEIASRPTTDARPTARISGDRTPVADTTDIEP
ncbi:MAG: DUF4166 domain-containing protein [Acetobacteraceae bacterium]|jgi:hypothetical protein